MKEMSANEVVSRFSAVLDSAESGETVVIIRDGRQVAMLVPAPRANGAALRNVLRRWQGHSSVDDAFAADVAAARESDSGLDQDPWAD